MASQLTSLVIPSRGGNERLPVLIESLRRQTVKTWEAIVVLDGDIDGSEQVLHRYATGLPIRWIVFDSNRGRSAALNAGFEEAAGSILVRCDDDLVPAPTFVAEHERVHRDDECGAVGLYRNVYPPTTYARVYGHEWDVRFRADAYAVPVSERWRYWAGNCSVTRAVWELVGPYDLQFRAYGWEDVDWGYRAHSLGIPIVLVHSLETEHRIAATTTASRAERAFYAGAARSKFEEKHGLVSQSPAAGSVWDSAVIKLAMSLNESRVTALGRSVDKLARALPRPIAKKAVALSIEASAVAGHLTGTAGSSI